jgi:hypothetical protein
MTKSSCDAKSHAMQEQPLPHGCDPLADLFDTSVVANEVYESLSLLRDRVTSTDPAQSALARGSLGIVRMRAMPPASGPFRQAPPFSRRYARVEALYRCGGRIESGLEYLALAIRRDWARNSWLSRHWTPMRVLLSLGVAALLGFDFFAWAFVVLAIRMFGSLFTGAAWAFPAERRRADPEARTWACWAGHLGDAIVLLAIAAGSIGAGSTTAGMVLVFALVAQLLATLARVAALQHGIQLQRLRLERVIRAGGTLIALGVAALIQVRFSGTPWGLLALLAAIPAFAYAALESARVLAVSYLTEHQPVSLLVGSSEVFTSSPQDSSHSRGNYTLLSDCQNLSMD